jgi:hypothetical protein
MITVSDIVMSEEFADEFLVTKTMVDVSTGVAVNTVSKPDYCIGTVIPSKTSLQYGADGTRHAASIDVYSIRMLVAGYKIDDSHSRKADIVTWRNAMYVVNVTEDFSHFGYHHSVADLLQVNPPKAEG